MRKMRDCRLAGVHASAGFASRDAPRRTDRPAFFPKLPQLFGEFLPCGGPIVADTVSKFLDVTFEVELVLFEP